MAITHVIYDFDGLLVDTEPCYKAVHKEILGRFGHEFTPELASHMMGRKEKEAFIWLIDKLNIGDKITPEQYIKEYDSMLTKMYAQCKPMPGAERLVRHLHKKGIPTALCSGSRSSKYGPRREPHKAWLDLIPIQVFIGDMEEIKHGKPYPDGFLATMNRFPEKPAAPSNILVFEDAPNGGRAAIAAGMRCVMVPADEHREEVMRLGVTKVINTLEEFRPEEFGLPPYD
ncbi:unnamed protein product [Cylicocyclus nassatus]|uniref:Uncharacterized protein n=1 Tax=Cylicocyclus nassatus TaxID=53992 RepID=A0AA36M500_CYLNA|nr:unnamed protein product [Cylicocyclus nassatus]